MKGILLRPLQELATGHNAVGSGQWGGRSIIGNHLGFEANETFHLLHKGIGNCYVIFLRSSWRVWRFHQRVLYRPIHSPMRKMVTWTTRTSRHARRHYNITCLVSFSLPLARWHPLLLVFEWCSSKHPSIQGYIYSRCNWREWQSVYFSVFFV